MKFYILSLLCILSVCSYGQLALPTSDPGLIPTINMSDEFNSEYLPGVVYNPNKWVDYIPWIDPWEPPYHPVDFYPGGGQRSGSCRDDDNDNISIESETVGSTTTSYLRLSLIEDVTECRNLGANDLITLNYSSGGLISAEQNLQRYGFFEIKMRIPENPNSDKFEGIAANAWLWNSWPSTSPLNDVYSEIDLAEIKSSEGNKHTFNVHWDPHYDEPSTIPVYPNDFPPQSLYLFVQNGYWQYRPSEDDVIWHSDSYQTLRGITAPWEIPEPTINDANLNGDWHTFTCLWLPGEIIFYLDQQFVGQTEFSGSGLDPLGWFVNPIAGNQFGEPVESINNSDLPYHLEVDYIHTYGFEYDCNVSIDQDCFDPETFDGKVKKSIRIGSGSCNNSLQSGEEAHFKAVDFIQLEKEFTVELGADFSAIIFDCPTN